MALTRRDFMKTSSAVGGAIGLGVAGILQPSEAGVTDGGDAEVSYDVIVVGGGPGGFAAAVAASRSGAKVLLAEREGCMGGAATTMHVHPFMSHTTSRGPDGRRKVVNAGIFAEVVRKLKARGAARGTNLIRFHEEALKLVLDEMAREAGVEVMYHTMLYESESGHRHVQAVRLAHNGGPIRAKAKVFVDGTGDGLLSARARAECMFGDDKGKVMNMGLMFTVAGVDTDAMPDRDEVKRMVRAGGKDKPVLINTMIGTLSVPRDGHVHINAVSIPGNPLDPGDLSFAEMEGRRRVDNFVEWLRANVPGFGKCYLLKTAGSAGVRESRRVKGDYVLSGEDFRRAAKFSDGVAACSYYADRHGRAQGGGRLGPGEYYQIPYRCLTAKGLENLLVVGRCISADIIVQSSCRIMPTSMCTGQAAGLAAAMSLPEGNVRAVDVQELRKSIVSAGGVIDA